MEPDRYAETPFGAARQTIGPHGYVAYFPKSVPRELTISHDNLLRIADAEAALGRLAGTGRLLPDPHLLVRPYLRREAVASTRIEGTQASLVDVFDAEASDQPLGADVEEVVNYVRAMEIGLQRLETLPLSTRLIREMHAVILAGVRGRERQPGELRTTQNWVGPAGGDDRDSSVRTAATLRGRRSPHGPRTVHPRAAAAATSRTGRAAALPVRDDPPVPRWQRPPRTTPHRLLPRGARSATGAAPVPLALLRGASRAVLRRPSRRSVSEGTSTPGCSCSSKRSPRKRLTPCFAPSDSWTSSSAIARQCDPRHRRGDPTGRTDHRAAGPDDEGRGGASRHHPPGCPEGAPAPRRCRRPRCRGRGSTPPTALARRRGALRPVGWDVTPAATRVTWAGPRHCHPTPDAERGGL